MKNVKFSRIFAVLMALALCTSMISPAFAERWFTLPDGTQIDLDQLGSEDSSTIIVPCSHNWGDWVTTKEPTVTKKGEQEHTCTKCGKTETEEIPAKGFGTGGNGESMVTCKHDLGEWKTTQEPTCTEAGSKTRSCDCGENTETETIAATGHDWGEWENVGWSNPIRQRVCKNDSSHIEREGNGFGTSGTIKSQCEQDGHPLTEEEVTKQPTCTEAGEKTVKCKCGEKTETQTTPATGHAYGEWTVTTPATETEAGEQTRVCANDPSHTEKQEIPATGTTTPVTPVTPVVPDPIPVTPVTPVTPEPPVVIDEPDVPLAEAPADETEVIEDADVPLAELPEEPAEEPAQAPAEELEVIEDGAVPLSDVPQTGEASTALWLAAVLIAGMGLVYVNTGKRRQNAR